MGETDWGGNCLLLMSGAMLSKSLIQFSVDGQGCVPSLLFDLRPNYGGGNEDNGDLLQKVLCKHWSTQCLQPYSKQPPTHASTSDSWTLMGKTGSVSCGVTASFSWVLVHTRFCLVDCGSDHELLVTKFRLKLKNVGKTTRPFKYDLNQIP